MQLIKLHYLRTWFIMDLLSTIPLDVVFQYGNLSKVVRFAKIGKIYKLIRVTKMVRLLQSAKLRSKFQT